MFKVIGYLIAALTIFGCSSYAPPAYQEPPENIPTANLTNSIWITGRYASATIIIGGGDQCRAPQTERSKQILYKVNTAQRPPLPPVKIAALQPIRLWYSYSSNQGTCDLAIDTFLLPNRNYKLQGGSTYLPGDGSFLSGSSGCTLSVIDEQTNTRIPSVRAGSVPVCDLVKPTENSPLLKMP
ncbi:MAG: hypothetical protein LBE33_05775 [Zoogloeaceae bacterium]|jgi:hypothetical protein|nr:hypothetical protein [Zoogloeaceae bacterium]